MFDSSDRTILQSKCDNRCSQTDYVILTPAMKQHNMILNFDHDYVYCYASLSLYSEQVVDYITGNVVRNVCKKINCVECLDVLQTVNTGTKYGLIKCKDVNDCLLNPSNDLKYLCKVAEKVFRSNEHILKRNGKNLILKLQYLVLSQLDRCLFKDYNHLFTSTEPGQESHYVKLIRNILKYYFTCRLHHALRNYSQQIRGNQVRQMYTKLILFKGQ